MSHPMIINGSYLRTIFVSDSGTVCVQAQDYVSVSAPFYHHCTGGSVHWFRDWTFSISIEYFVDKNSGCKIEPVCKLVNRAKSRGGCEVDVFAKQIAYIVKY